jgi:hypothetical protein
MAKIKKYLSRLSMFYHGFTNERLLVECSEREWKMDQVKVEKILRRCVQQTEKLQGGKSDFAYHNTRSSLHSIWTEVYESGDKSDRITEINACLKRLEEKAQENELKKYQDYYGRSPPEMEQSRVIYQGSRDRSGIYSGQDEKSATGAS